MNFSYLTGRPTICCIRHLRRFPAAKLKTTWLRSRHFLQISTAAVVMCANCEHLNVNAVVCQLCPLYQLYADKCWIYSVPNGTKYEQFWPTHLVYAGRKIYSYFLIKAFPYDCSFNLVSVTF